MSPPAAASHGDFQFEIGFRLRQCLSGGRVSTECPISTADGVRVADVAWASSARVQDSGKLIVHPRAPEICVEVISPDNSAREMREKTELYFDAGALEVWHCSQTGEMTFFAVGEPSPLRASQLCPDFPAKVELR
jgi:Uma2 family endonuclease